MSEATQKDLEEAKGNGESNMHETEIEPVNRAPVVNAFATAKINEFYELKVKRPSEYSQRCYQKRSELVELRLGIESQETRPYLGELPEELLCEGVVVEILMKNDEWSGPEEYEVLIGHYVNQRWQHTNGGDIGSSKKILGWRSIPKIVGHVLKEIDQH